MADRRRSIEAFASDTRKVILKAIREGATTPKDMAERSGMAPELVRKTLGRMVKRGEVNKTRYGEDTLSHLSQCHTSEGEE